MRDKPPTRAEALELVIAAWAIVQAAVVADAAEREAAFAAEFFGLTHDEALGLVKYFALQSAEGLIQRHGGDAKLAALELQRLIDGIRDELRRAE